jgi:hypothetical protein
LKELSAGKLEVARATGAILSEDRIHQTLKIDPQELRTSPSKKKAARTRVGAKKKG